MLTVINKDPSHVVPNIKETDILIVRNEKHYPDNYKQIYIGITFYDTGCRFFRILGAGGTIDTSSKTSFEKKISMWGWEAESLLQLMINTFRRWVYENGNTVVEYIVIRQVSDLPFAFSRFTYLSDDIKKDITRTYERLTSRPNHESH